MSRCRACHAAIRWAETEAGRPIPLDPKPVADGNIVIERRAGKSDLARVIVCHDDPDGPRYVSHFATCPAAAEFRGARTRKGAP